MSKKISQNLQILCCPFIGYFSTSSCGLEQINTKGEADSPFGYFSRYSSWAMTSSTSTQPRRQLVGRLVGNSTSLSEIKCKCQNYLSFQCLKKLFQRAEFKTGIRRISKFDFITLSKPI